MRTALLWIFIYVMLIIEKKKKRLRVKLSLAFCLSSVLRPMERLVLSDALHPFDGSGLPTHDAASLSFSLCGVRFVSPSVRVSVRPRCMFTCQPAGETNLYVYVQGSLTGIDSLWGRAPFTTRALPGGNPAVGCCALPLGSTCAVGWPRWRWRGGTSGYYGAG